MMAYELFWWDLLSNRNTMQGTIASFENILFSLLFQSVAAVAAWSIVQLPP